jgi:light-regulated signal transduction histidine kinase (bacteriophytochrome)
MSEQHRHYLSWEDEAKKARAEALLKKAAEAARLREALRQKQDELDHIADESERLRGALRKIAERDCFPLTAEDTAFRALGDTDHE